jgi:hypothetical protein
MGTGRADHYRPEHIKNTRFHTIPPYPAKNPPA